MIRATYQKRLAALILGLRPNAAHIYGVDRRISVDNLTANGLEAWSTGLRMIAEDLADPSVQLTPTETWIADWVDLEIQRDAQRWADGSTVLELLALSLGPTSLDPSHLRPERFWSAWTQNLHEHRTRLDTGRTTVAGDSADLARHCRELAISHEAPEGMVELLNNVATATRTVRHQPEVFRPLTTPGERLQLSAMLASAYSIGARGCAAAEARLLEQRPPLLDHCSRA